MKAALIIAVFFGWGVAGAYMADGFPSIAFLAGLGVGAGAMLYNRKE